MAGYFYAMANKSFRGLLKLGHVTGRDPDERAKELSCATGVPTPFQVAYSFHCDDPRELEVSVHRRFARRRVRRQREFFRVSVPEVQDYVESLFPRDRWHEPGAMHAGGRLRCSPPPDARLLTEIQQAGGLIAWVRAAREEVERG